VLQTPLCDGSGLKHTLERRVFALLQETIGEVHFRMICGDLIIVLGIPLPIYGLRTYKHIVRAMLPLISYFPLSMIFYGSGGAEQT